MIIICLSQVFKQNHWIYFLLQIISFHNFASSYSFIPVLTSLLGFRFNYYMETIVINFHFLDAHLWCQLFSFKKSIQLFQIFLNRNLSKAFLFLANSYISYVFIHFLYSNYSNCLLLIFDHFILCFLTIL